jgi:disulfide bond formation protein DsbB
MGTPATANFALTTLVLTTTFALLLAVILSGRTVVETAAVASPTPLPQPTATLLTSLPTPELVSYGARQVSEGSSIFQTNCSACHGQAAQGVPGLGPNLIESEFVHGISDDELLAFIIVGRMPWDEGNVTGIAMPARGGNPALTDDNLRAVIAYIRTSTNPGLVAEPAGDTASSEAATGPVVPAAPFVYAFGTPEGFTMPDARPFDARAAYALSCSGCHGIDGAGAPPYGPPLNVTTPDALYDFLVAIDLTVDPAVDFPHPVYAEYPALSEAQLRALTVYVADLLAGR